MRWSATLRLAATTFFLVCLAQGPLWGNPYPLSKIPVPEPENLSLFVSDKAAAVRLGKALFWDMQAGSDGVLACASCHFKAGADDRLTNQLHPGPAIPPALQPRMEIGSGPNYTLQPFDFPFFQVFPVDSRLGIDPDTGLPLDPGSFITRNFNDIAGSQGITLVDFLNINAGSPLDSGIPRLSPHFGSSRQVTGRNAPSVINAVFNYSNFWDGRANNIFNGENPLGPLDQQAGVWLDENGALVKQKIALRNASLASQATGPPLNSVEMSYAGRTFPQLGRKLLSLPPLAGQMVHPRDSVLGGLSRAVLQADGTLSGAPGLVPGASYAELIREAFDPRYWSSSQATAEGFSQMEANFSLFWGLAIQLYEATLVSDQTPFDRFTAGNVNALSLPAQNGFATFVSKCAVCHSGSEFSAAAVGSNLPACLPPDCNLPVFTNNTSQRLVQTGQTVSGGLSDAGFMNIGVRPTSDDPGRGGVIGLSLSFSRLAQLASQGDLPFVTPKLPAGTTAGTPTDVNGAFKIPGIRNVELTAPYFHNGSMLTLEQVMEFYTRGGNFPENPELALAMQPIRNLKGNATKRSELVEFMKSLTDERVRNESAPFDHPELRIPSGDVADTMTTLAATGGGTAVPVPPALVLDPFITPTSATSQTFTGTVDASATVEVRVNQLASAFGTVTGNLWSITVTGLPVGNNTLSLTARTDNGGVETLAAPFTVLPTAALTGVPPGGRTTQTGADIRVGGSGVVSYRWNLNGGPYSADTPIATPIVFTGLADATYIVAVLGLDAFGNLQPEASPTLGIWSVKATPPLLTLTPPSSPTNGASQTIGGTVELGSTPSVTVDSGAVVGPVKTIGGVGVATWSCEITGLKEGANNVTVRAFDFVFNLSTVTGAIVLDSVAPVLTLNPAAVSVRVGEVVNLAGTVEAGLAPVVTVDHPAQVGAVALAGPDWSCQLSELTPGDNQITVSARDAAGNLTSRVVPLRVVFADGNFKGSGSADISDALKALRITVGLDQTGTLDLLHGDVAPLVNGKPEPDGRIGLPDALVILRKVVGLISF
jgi:cytochrome c peroxidase